MLRTPTFHDAGVHSRQIEIDRPLGVVDLDVPSKHRRRVLPQHQPEVSVEGWERKKNVIWIYIFVRWNNQVEMRERIPFQFLQNSYEAQICVSLFHFIHILIFFFDKSIIFKKQCANIWKISWKLSIEFPWSPENSPKTYLLGTSLLHNEADTYFCFFNRFNASQNSSIIQTTNPPGALPSSQSKQLLGCQKSTCLLWWWSHLLLLSPAIPDQFQSPL